MFVIMFFFFLQKIGNTDDTYGTQTEIGISVNNSSEKNFYALKWNFFIGKCLEIDSIKLLKFSYY